MTMQFKGVGEAAAQLFTRVSGYFPFDSATLESSRQDLTQLFEQWLKDVLARLDLVSKEELLNHQRAINELSAHAQTLAAKVQLLEQQLECKVGPLDNWLEENTEQTR